MTVLLGLLASPFHCLTTVQETPSNTRTHTHTTISVVRGGCAVTPMVQGVAKTTFALAATYSNPSIRTARRQKRAVDIAFLHFQITNSFRVLKLLMTGIRHRCMPVREKKKIWKVIATRHLSAKKKKKKEKKDANELRNKPSGATEKKKKKRNTPLSRRSG